MKKAADEKSPGTSICVPRRAPGVTDTRPASTLTSMPNARSIRSVWSRVTAGSVTEVVPLA